MGRQVAAVILCFALAGCATMMPLSSYCRLSPEPFNPSAKAAKHMTQKDKDWITLNNERRVDFCGE